MSREHWKPWHWLARLAWFVIALEIGAYVSIWVLQEQRPTRADLADQVAGMLATNSAPGQQDEAAPDPRSFRTVRHPYLGYSPSPAPRKEQGRLSILASNEMANPDSPLYDEDTLVVGLTGGSVAAAVFNSGGDALVRRLKSAPWLKGRKIHLFGYAGAGYKQPQQAIGLAYLLAAGVRFDAVVSLDGFNEIALTFDAGLAKGKFPAYPYSWSSRMALSSDQIELAGELAYLKRQRSDAGMAYQSSPLGWLWMRKLAWWLGDRQVMQAQESVRGVLSVGNDLSQSYRAAFERLGPSLLQGAPKDLVPELTAVWERGTRLMQDLCDGSGSLFLCALQPNQYDPEFTKPMGPKERRVALNDESKFAAPAHHGYPYLREASEHLREDGIDILDLKSLFAGDDQMRFLDDCCHFNPSGSMMIAEALADALLARGLGQ